MTSSPTDRPAGHRPRKRFGQHFLRREQDARRIAALVPEDASTVIEIGPGAGILTGHLARRGRRTIAVEVDRDLARALRERFPSSGPGAVEVLEADALDVDWERLVEDGEVATVVGNLPYNISKPVASRIVDARAAIARAVLMFQREVAERLTAAPGSKTYGPMSVRTRSAFDVRRAFDLGPGAFRPPPAVESTVTVWDRLEGGALPDDLDRRLRRVLAACFARRRRTLRNNLAPVLPDGDRDVRDLLGRVGVDPGERAENLSPETFRELARHWPDGAA